ncbi:MAG: MotA/TolQ/ExbB proton channel family protein [Shewanella sp.]
MPVDNFLLQSITSLYFSIMGFIELGGGVMWPLFACCMLMLWLASSAFFNQKIAVFTFPITTKPWLDQRLNQLALRHHTYQQRGRLQGVKLLAMIAPLLGLLGTVSGMITMFEAGANYGFHDPAVISAGISMAMVTTQTGLLVGLTGAGLAFYWQRKLQRKELNFKIGARHAQ